jgi:general L-amino acid transport system permease protein
MTLAVRPVDARPRLLRARRWAHANLFSTSANSVLTVVTVIILGWVVFSLGRFVLSSADWSVIEANRRLLAVGRFPQGEEWRLWPPLYAVLGFGGLAFGSWLTISRGGFVLLLGVLVFTFGVLFEGQNGLLLAGGVALSAVAYIGAQRTRDTRIAKRVRPIAVVGLALVVPLMVVMLQVGDGVRTSAWGGIFLNLMLAAVGISLGFPVGLGMAIGRASSLPVVRWVCTAYIELVRAAPLVAWLFMARFVLPDFLPPVAGLDQVDIITRAILVLAAFTGAYVAEIVRSGLQSVPPGQIEASEALGMNVVQTTTLIVLPQALRAVIPALVSQFISLWKDTTLVFALGLTDFLGAGEATLAQTDFIGREKEVFAFIALGFWAVAFAMSRLSQRIERGLGVGLR